MMQRHTASNNDACLRVEHDGTVRYDGDTSSSDDSDASSGMDVSEGSHSGHEGEADAAEPIDKAARFSAGNFYQQRKRTRRKAKAVDVYAAAETNVALRRAITGQLDATAHFAPVPFLRPKTQQGGRGADDSPTASPTKSILGDAHHVVQYSPPPLDHASLTAFDAQIVVFGGNHARDGASDATWVYDAQKLTWESSIGGVCPAARCGHCAHAYGTVPPVSALKTVGTKTAIVPAEAASSPQAIIFGGANLQRGEYFNDVWAFDAHRRTWRCLHPGSVASSHAVVSRAAAVPGHGHHVGDAAGAASATFQSVAAPSRRWKAVCAVREGRLYVFGGESSDFTVMGDLSVFDIHAGLWRAVRNTSTPAPSPRYLHAACTLGDRMLVVGGTGPNAGVPVEDDTWVLELSTLLWRRVKAGGYRPKAAAKGAAAAPPKYQRLEEGSPFIDPAVHSQAVAALRRQEAGDDDVSATAINASTVPAASLLMSPGVASIGVPNGSVLFGSGAADASSSHNGVPAMEQHALALARRGLEGHVLMPFDDLVLVHGGRYGRNGGINNDLFVFDVPNEKWLRIAPHLHRGRQATAGGVPEPAASTLIPPGRCFHAAAPVTHFSVTTAMAHALPLNALAQSGIHFTDERETAQYVEALSQLIQHQQQARGLLTTHQHKPVLAHHTHTFVFGGSGGSGARVEYSDCYRVTVDYDDSMPKLE